MNKQTFILPDAKVYKPSQSVATDSSLTEQTEQASGCCDKPALRSESQSEAEGCCGGPAPDGTDACCIKDANAKAEGKSGCGC